MNIIGSCDIPLVLMPEDRIRRMTVRMVEGLPYGLILGAAFLRQNASVINFTERGGFKPAPRSSWVPPRSTKGCPTQPEINRTFSNNTWNKGDTEGLLLRRCTAANDGRAGRIGMTLCSPKGW